MFIQDAVVGLHRHLHPPFIGSPMHSQYRNLKGVPPNSSNSLYNPSPLSGPLPLSLFIPKLVLQRIVR